MSIMTKMAMEIYKPPFRFERGYFYDSENNMVADKHEELRIRGWGRISYMPEPEALQDHIAELIAQAMSEFWQSKDSEQAAITPGVKTDFNRSNKPTGDSSHVSHE